VLKTVSLLGLVLASPVFAEDYEAIVDCAFEAIDDNFEES